MLQIFEIGKPFDPKRVKGQLLKTRAHDSVYGAYTYEFRVAKGRIVFSVMNNTLHEVTYECPKWLPWSKRKRNRFLLEAYQSGGQWKRILKNVSGEMLQSNDDVLYASWSKITDTTSVGTLYFYEEKYRLVN